MGSSAKYGFAVALFLAVCPFLSGSEEKGALLAIRQFSQTSHLVEGENVLGLVGFYGDPLPPQWLILTNVKNEPGVLKESVWKQGNVVAERRFQKLPEQDLPDLPIQIDEVRLDAGAAFVKAETAAKENEVSFESVHYQLRCREIGREPVWMLSLLNRSQVVVGVVYLSGLNGDVLKAAWPLLERRKYSDSQQGS